jgi:5'-3' exoribonuclease 2
MGVPAFFRWLCRKYPSIVMQCHQEKGKKDPFTDETISVDTSQPNPNGIEFDNLYLDMNGIIHPCTHPEDRLFYLDNLNLIPYLLILMIFFCFIKTSTKE